MSKKGISNRDALIALDGWRQEKKHGKGAVKITELEKALLLAIVNDYDQDGTDAEDVVDHEIWMVTHEVVRHLAGFEQAKTLSGVMASLVKKGLAGVYKDGEDSTCWITSEGYESIKEFI